MNQDIENIIKENELTLNKLNRKIEKNIAEEESRISCLNKKLKKSIIGLIILGIIGYGSFEAYKLKKEQDILFENSMYYQVMENETLENISETFCKDSCTLDNLVEFNKKYDKTFDSIAEEGEIIHFPKRYVKNTDALNNFIEQIDKLNKNLEKNKRLVEDLFKETVTKQKIDEIKKIIDETDSEINRINDFQEDRYFSKSANYFIERGSNLISEIEKKINFEIKKVDSKFNSLYNALKNTEWNKPGTIERLDELTLKNNEIKYFYDCFENVDRTAKLNKMDNLITDKKKEYYLILDNVKKTINNDKYLVNSLQRQVDLLLKNGLQNKELSMIKQLRGKTTNISSYTNWKDEERLKKDINDYSTKVNTLNSSINQKFYYAVRLINKEIKKYEDEIDYGEKTGRINNADVRLRYIMKNPLSMIKYRYELLGYSAGINRTNRLINKINSFVKN
jgi:hypothetical protein